MDRETKTITTPIGNRVVELKAYLIGREKRAINNAYLQGKSLSFNMEENEVRGIEGSLVERAEDIALRTVIVSIDGKTDGAEGFNLVEEILNMHSADYAAIVAAVNAVTSDKDFTQEKKAN